MLTSIDFEASSRRRRPSDLRVVQERDAFREEVIFLRQLLGTTADFLLEVCPPQTLLQLEPEALELLVALTERNR